MSASNLQKPLQALGVTPWQAIVGIALAGFYLGEMKPQLTEVGNIAASVEKLNLTVHALTTRVEVHAVLLNSIQDLHTDVKENREETRAEIKALREELSRIYGKLAVNRTKTEDLFGELKQPNELSPVK